jgi:hypothetical protein
VKATYGKGENICKSYRANEGLKYRINKEFPELKTIKTSNVT